MEKGYQISVLDHGYVKLVDSMGTDETIVETARMSTGRGFVSWDPYKRCRRCDSVEGVDPPMSSQSAHVHDWQDFPRGDLGLLDRMWREGHATPFEFCTLVVEVQAPLMVFREWHRHRTQYYSEFSARYSQMPNLHYVPSRERVQKQSTTNKQGSSTEEHIGSLDFLGELVDDQNCVYEAYDRWVKEGVAKEVARINTPVSRYSKMRAGASLRNWLAFLKLRQHPAAQWEIRQYAEAVAKIVEALWSKTWALFVEHDRDAVKLSATEARQVKEALTGSSLVLVEAVAKKLGC